ncbi:MAG: fructosamine kinase family protein [Oligoflexales bacterium]
MDLSKEANGLKEIAKYSIIKTPKVLTATPGLLVLEWIETQNPEKKSFTNFAVQLAKLHKITNESYGFYENNYIGSLPQENPLVTHKKNEWIGYFFHHRILTQVQLAENQGYADASLLRSLAKLESEIPRILENSLEPPSLVHGDLWSGNFMIGPMGAAYLIDPAVYYGHREVDLAMTQLFGGFPKSFYDAYAEEYPLQPGFEKRCRLYQIYYLLAHLNLFGPSYYQQCLGVIEGLLKKALFI